MEIMNLEPVALWKNFKALNAVPRPSKGEARVIAFMEAFGKRLNLETIRDQTGNVIIKKPASPGMETRPTVVLQAHLDMVHQKNKDTDFDFASRGIEMYIDGDWVKARGTTLGADNGIGVAAIMSILASDSLSHPALEALFTIDEETGMTGAKNLDPQHISGRLLLNLDTEEDDELTIGCAGGLDTTATAAYSQEPVPSRYTSLRLELKGLSGGHSGMDIHKGRGNANKLMNRLLFESAEKFDLRLAELEGGSLRNAIPREAQAIVLVPEDAQQAFGRFVSEFSQKLGAELRLTEPGLTITCQPAPRPEQVMEGDFFKKMVRAVYAVPNGVYRMSPEIDGLVEASSNLAKLRAASGRFEMQSLQRSSVESTKADVAASVRCAFENMGCVVTFSGAYPGWAPNKNSAILRCMQELYQAIFRAHPRVGAVHAGLECGILGAHFPGMDMISFGPTIRGAHSPDERVSISSVARFYDYLCRTLTAIPEAGTRATTEPA